MRLIPKLGGFSRNVLVMLTGTVAAQAISVLVSPILTRLYTPSDFGVLTLFVSVISLLGSIISGRYEHAITLPATNREGCSLLILCTLVALVLSSICGALVFIYYGEILALLRQPRLEPWLWSVPGALFITGFSTAARYWFLRIQSFQVVALNSVLRTTVTAVLNISFGLLGYIQYGLIGGFLLGLVVAGAFLAIRIWTESGTEMRRLHCSELRQQAVAHRRFPLYSACSALVESGAAQIPIFFFSSLFGAATLGFFSLAHRMANLPLTLVASSVGDVFRQQASEDYARVGQCLELFDRTCKRLVLMSVPPMAVGACIAPSAFAMIFGETWRESGEYVRLLVPALALRFISSPLSSMFYIAGRQAADLTIQVMLVGIMFLAFWWMAHLKSAWGPREAILVYSVIYSGKYLVELSLSRQFSRGRQSL